MKRVLLADNHPLIRAAVKSLLNPLEDFEVVAEAADAETCLVQIALVQPDIVVLDLNMPGKSGFRVLEDLRKKGTEVSVFVLSMYSGREFVERAQALGARGFVTKEDVGHELVALLQSTSRNFLMSSSAGTASVEEHRFQAGQINNNTGILLKNLTHSELRVLRLIADEKSSEDIAQNLGVSVRTIHTHRQNIRQKLSLKGANALAVFAAKEREAIFDD